MKISPIDIKKQQFKKVLRGFDPVEVETFMGMIASEMDDLGRTNKDLQNKLIETQTQLSDYKVIEKTLHETLLQAQEVSQKSADNSKRESQLIIQDAELKANQILDKARTDQTRLKEEVAILKVKKSTITNRLKLLLNSELELIKALEVDEEILLTDDVDSGHKKEYDEYDDIINKLNNDN